MVINGNNDLFIVAQIRHRYRRTFGKGGVGADEIVGRDLKGGGTPLAKIPHIYFRKGKGA
jgi:hypothetical protein